MLTNVSAWRFNGPDSLETYVVTLRQRKYQITVSINVDGYPVADLYDDADSLVDTYTYTSDYRRYNLGEILSEAYRWGSEVAQEDENDLENTTEKILDILDKKLSKTTTISTAEIQRLVAKLKECLSDGKE